MVFGKVKKAKKDPTVINVTTSPVDRELLEKLENTIRISAESRHRDTTLLIKSNQDLAKALNAATREFKKTK